MVALTSSDVRCVVRCSYSSTSLSAIHLSANPVFHAPSYAVMLIEIPPFSPQAIYIYRQLFDFNFNGRGRIRTYVDSTGEASRF